MNHRAVLSIDTFSRAMSARLRAFRALSVRIQSREERTHTSAARARLRATDDYADFRRTSLGQ